MVEPDGPIKIRRYDPAKGEARSTAKLVNISGAMVRRVANAITENTPLNLDRALGASYNTRSALETLMAHTPQFYYCYPGRIDVSESSTKIEEGHKHLLWLPDDPHKAAELVKRDVMNMTISEIPTMQAVYEALVIPANPDADPSKELSVAVQRRHAQIQIALVEVGRKLGFRTWVAQNDKGIEYKGKRLGELDGVIARLEDQELLAIHGSAVRAALMIDVIWFRNAHFMPAVIEVEHTTGVTSGLSRMKNFQDNFPPFQTRWVICAPDEDRSKVVSECYKAQFKSLKAYFLPYSAVDELYSITQRRTIRGVKDEFLETFMEPCVKGLTQ